MTTLLSFDRETLLQLDRSIAREWLLSDGLGGYASSTVLCCPTRRYHGLLVTPPPGSTKRHVFLARFEEWFHGGGKAVALSMARYRGTYAPLGHQGIERFELAPLPRWTYTFGRATLEREILLVRGQPTVLVRYRVSGQSQPVEMRLRPLLPFREADRLTFENEHLDARMEHLAGGIVVRPYPSLPAIRIVASGAAEFDTDPLWHKDIEYPVDLARGYEGHEDNFTPGVFRIAMEPGVDVVVAATLGDTIADPREMWTREHGRRVRAARHVGRDVRARIAHTADDFLYRASGAPGPSGGGSRTGVIAGFPWFGEWGRDTCISLPGLLLARGRVNECALALEGLLPYLERGLLPNIFGVGKHDSDYGSADASLWFARAVRLLENASADPDDCARRFLPALREIAAHYTAGTGLALRQDDAGLLVAGSPELNATWMDARTSQGPVTPRDGCAVELNALWYSLLAHLELCETRAADPLRAAEWKLRKERAGAAFLERFWLPRERYLADVWKDGRQDTSVRPNMVIAASLELSPLTRAMRCDVLRCARVELLTPFGLRTLQPRDDRYRGRYAGGAEERDRAYHQGTVWPWLLGAFVEGWLRAFGNAQGELRFLRELLDGFAPALESTGLLHVPEVFDGDPPHRPGGTIAQAWSSAELLRAYELLAREETSRAAGSRDGAAGDAQDARGAEHAEGASA